MPKFEYIAEEIEQSGLFDRDWYAQQYSDTKLLEMSPLEHFVRFGLLLQRDPGPGFSVHYYLDTNPDVAAAGVSPLLHYIRHGEGEGRRPRPEPKPSPTPLSAPQDVDVVHLRGDEGQQDRAMQMPVKAVEAYQIKAIGIPSVGTHRAEKRASPEMQRVIEEMANARASTPLALMKELAQAQRTIAELSYRKQRLLDVYSVCIQEISNLETMLVERK